jgi:hypothetical protein
MSAPQNQMNEFEKAAQSAPKGVVFEFLGFLRENKKWWLIPMLLVMLIFGVVVALGATGAAPFIYTLF